MTATVKTKVCRGNYSNECSVSKFVMYTHHQWLKHRFCNRPQSLSVTVQLQTMSITSLLHRCNSCVLQCVVGVVSGHPEINFAVIIPLSIITVTNAMKYEPSYGAFGAKISKFSLP